MTGSWKQLGLSLGHVPPKSKRHLSDALRNRYKKPPKGLVKLAPGELDDDLDGIL